VALCVLLGGNPVAWAEADDRVPPDEGGTIVSMGQPPLWMPYIGLAAGAYEPAGDDVDATGTLTVGLFRNLLNPVIAVGVAAEGYVGVRGANVDGGVRGLVAFRPLRFGIGVDYNIATNSPDLLLSFLHPLRRGGLFGLGGRLRVDYLPTRNHSFNIGFTVPLGQRWMGDTRAQHDHVKLTLPKQQPESTPAVGPALSEALAHVRDAADWINRFATPFFDPGGGSRDDAEARFVERVEHFKEHIAETSALYPEGRSYPAEERVYHAELDRAFSIAAAGGRDPGVGKSTPLGREISAQAREILLEEVVLPYNRLLGRIKRPDSTLGYAARARDAFLLWLNRQPQIAAGARSGLQHVLQTLLDAIEENRAGSARYWETSELVWIPIRLALRPDQLETQAQLDRLFERAVETEFSGGNEHHYLVNEQFQWELRRHIHAAEDYHVLWIHDFRGTGNDKEADQMGFELVLEGYLEAMTARVRDYDRTGKLPTYMIFLDQNFYEPNRGRIWMSFLQDPLRAKLKLPGGDHAREKEAAIAQAQAELRSAVAESTLLQQRARTYGDDWLHNRLQVHVNITNPVDWSYWSHRVIPVLGLPDVLMRDHRKISFYDVSEADPARGEAIFTGMGVGDHYAGPTWEDRAILVAGPALVDLKGAARDMLRNQGFAEDEIPYPLLPQPKPDDYGDRIAAREAAGFEYRSMQIHNATGYGPKPINTAKALLYDAMPADSVLIVPDSLWNSPFWAGMLAGAALRGAMVLAISPALDNAPSAGFPQMSRAQEIFTEMIVLQQLMKSELESVGGALHTGIYAVDVDVGDLAGRAALQYDNLLESRRVVESFLDFSALEDPERWSEYVEGNRRNKARILEALAEAGFEPDYAVDDVDKRKPKLHMKAQLLVNRAGLDNIAQVDWGMLIERWTSRQARRIAGGEEYGSVRDRWRDDARVWRGQAELARSRRPPEEHEKALGYLTVGSHNMDYRGMMMDGEVIYVTSGLGVMPAFRDLLVIAGVSTWVDDLDELEALVPAYSEWQRRVGRFIKYAL
jgi:phosphatidylserine/phosphatidylglycerophosphate/cardiolipin synthase-like enzyme